MTNPSSLAQRYAPHVYLDVREPYWPCTYADYIRNSRIIKPDGTVVVDKIADPNIVAKYDGNYRLDLKKDARAGMRDKTKFPSKLEMYCIEKRITYGDVDQPPSYDMIDIYYIMIYAYNGTLEPHDSDREFVMIRIRDNTPYAMFFSHHSGGYWRWWKDVQKASDGRPNIYAAIESHAFFDAPGTYRRILGFGNDTVTPRAIPLSFDRDYDLVMAGTQADLTKRPYMGSRIGRTSVDGSSFFYSWNFEHPQTGASPTDYPSLLKSKFGFKVTILTFVCIMSMLYIMYAAIHQKKYVLALAGPLGVVLGLLWFIETSPYKISNTVDNTPF